jgi:hypothetical protein
MGTATAGQTTAEAYYSLLPVVAKTCSMAVRLVAGLDELLELQFAQWSQSTATWTAENARLGLTDDTRAE